jgi:hypothetical protein
MQALFGELPERRRVRWLRRDLPERHLEIAAIKGLGPWLTISTFSRDIAYSESPAASRVIGSLVLLGALGVAV